jgi:hypothetical protein
LDDTANTVKNLPTHKKKDQMIYDSGIKLLKHRSKYIMKGKKNRKKTKIYTKEGYYGIYDIMMRRFLIKPAPSLPGMINFK